jgi:hypothetical protein
MSMDVAEGNWCMLQLPGEAKYQIHIW